MGRKREFAFAGVGLVALATAAVALAGEQDPLHRRSVCGDQRAG